MDFDEIADQQGWNDWSCLSVVREFISRAGLQEALDAFAQEKAEEENRLDLENRNKERER